MTTSMRKVSHRFRGERLAWRGAVGTTAEPSFALTEANAHALSLASESGDPWWVAVALFQLGALARAEGDRGRAEALVKESLSAFRDIGDRADAVAPIWFCGLLAIERGARRRGARLIAAADPQHARRPWLQPDDRQAYEEILAASSAAGDDELARAWEERRAMTLEQAVAYALGEQDGPSTL
jgi:hypothetical protein